MLHCSFMIGSACLNNHVSSLAGKFELVSGCQFTSRLLKKKGLTIKCKHHPHHKRLPVCFPKLNVFLLAFIKIFR